MAGLFLGLFALKPQSIVGIFCFVLLQRRWKAAAATLVSGGAVTALGFVLFEEPSRHFASLSTATFVWSRTAAASPWNQVGFFRLGTNLLDPWSPALGTVAGVALMLAALSCLVLVSARRHPVGSRDWDFALAMVIALSLGLSPYMFHYDAGLLAIAFALVAHRLARAPSSPNEPYLSDPRASAAIFVMCLSMALSPGLFVRVHELTGWSAWVQPSTLCLAYFVWAVFRARLEPGDRAEGV